MCTAWSLIHGVSHRERTCSTCLHACAQILSAAVLYRTMCAVVRVAMIVHVVCLSRAMPVFILRCRLAISRRRRPSSARSSCAHVRVESCTVGVWAGARPVTSCTSGHKFIRGVWNGSTHASIEVSSARNRTRAESKSNYATLSLTHVTTSRQRASRFHGAGRSLLQRNVTTSCLHPARRNGHRYSGRDPPTARVLGTARCALLRLKPLQMPCMVPSDQPALCRLSARVSRSTRWHHTYRCRR